MSERLIRIGRVSTINREKGMVTVTYPDLDNSVTDEFPLFSFTDEFKIPKIGSNVLVLHLSNGQSAGYVLGHYWNNGNNPPDPEAIFRKEMSQNYGEAYIEFKNGTLTIHADKIILDGSVTGTKDIVASGKSVIGHTHTDSRGGRTSSPI